MENLSTIEKPEHITPEMSRLIIEVTDAERKDEARIAKWRDQYDKQKKEWESKSESDQRKFKQIGRGFVYFEKTPLTLHKYTRAVRRVIRHRIFRIRDNNRLSYKYDNGLKAWIQLQLKENGLSFNDFTFDWDVSALEPLKIVQPMEWDGDLVLDPHTKKKHCDPSAFTKQEM